MKTKTLLINLAIALAVVAGCGDKINTGSNAEPETNTPVADAPVETKAANTQYKPAFAAQTRIAGARPVQLSSRL